MSILLINTRNSLWTKLIKEKPKCKVIVLTTKIVLVHALLWEEGNVKSIHTYLEIQLMTTKQIRYSF